MRLIRLALFALAPLLLALQTGDRVGFDGFGEIRIGMSEAELRAAHPSMLSEGPLEGSDCHYLADGGNLPGLAFMIIAGRLVRIDVFEGATTTGEGARIGMTATDLFALYPERSHTQPHPYASERDKVLHHRSADGASAMAFEVVGGRIQTYRLGLFEPVQFIEGCS